MNELVKSEYQGHEINFTGDGWFNATEVATKFGRVASEWIRLPSTSEYISALERRYGKIPYVKTSKARADRGGGTWLHPKLGVRFSQWLDIDFAVWCDEQIDSILRGRLDQKKMRHEAASSFKVMTSVLQLVREEQGKVTESHHFSNEARLINWAISGKFQSIDRDSLNAEELRLLAKLEEKNSVLIGRGADYKTRKSVLEQFVIDIRCENKLLKAA